MGVQKSKEQIVVAAIEIGSENCGFAYSIESTSNEIYSGSHGLIHPDDRFPSKFLLDNDWNLIATGTIAADKFRNYALQGEHATYIYFDSVKVSYDTKKRVCIKDHIGNAQEADKLYKVIIKHLYEQCIDTIREETGLNPTNTKLVLTIQSTDYEYLWDILYSAALETKLSKESISIFYEKDAVTAYCKQQLLSIKVNKGASTIPRETNFAVANIGGTKTEICTRTQAVSIPFGGVTVSTAFMKELQLFLGMDEKRWADFQREHICDVMGVIKAFENIRNKFDRSNEYEIIELPPSFIEVINTEKEPQSTISFKRNNKIVMSRKLMETFFNEGLETFVKKFEHVCEQIILLSGWFSENPYVRDYIVTNMKNKKVILVPYPSLAVLKGAFTMIYEPCSSRTFSYGIAILKEFQEGDPDSLRETRNGIDYCKNYFMLIIEKNKPLKDREVLLETHFSFELKDANEDFFLHLYKSDSRTPTYCTDSGCSYFHGITRPVPKDGWNCDTVPYMLRVIGIDNGLLVEVESHYFEIKRHIPLL